MISKFNTFSMLSVFMKQSMESIKKNLLPSNTYSIPLDKQILLIKNFVNAIQYDISIFQNHEPIKL